METVVINILFSLLNLILGIANIEKNSLSKYFSFWVSGFCAALAVAAILTKNIN